MNFTNDEMEIIGQLAPEIMRLHHAGIPFEEALRIAVEEKMHAVFDWYDKLEKNKELDRLVMEVSFHRVCALVQNAHEIV